MHSAYFKNKETDCVYICSIYNLLHIDVETPLGIEIDCSGSWYHCQPRVAASKPPSTLLPIICVCACDLILLLSHVSIR